MAIERWWLRNRFYESNLFPIAIIIRTYTSTEISISEDRIGLVRRIDKTHPNTKPKAYFTAIKVHCTVSYVRSWQGNVYI